MIEIHLTREPEDIERCFPVMFELRPHLVQSEFLARVHSQQREGYLLARLEDNGAIKAVAGFRLLENLAWGKFLYVDDMVTSADARSCGHGEALFQWLVDYAKTHNCAQLHLDSGVQRFDAHRFYLRHKMQISSHHFALLL